MPVSVKVCLTLMAGVVLFVIAFELNELSNSLADYVVRHGITSNCRAGSCPPEK